MADIESPLTAEEYRSAMNLMDLENELDKITKDEININKQKQYIEKKISEKQKS